MNLPDDVRYAFEKAGWHPERNIRDVLPLPEEYEVLDVALDVLSEFGMLRVFQEGPGISCAKSGVNLDPSLASGEEDEVNRISKLLGMKFYPLGEALNGRIPLLMDASGKVFLMGEGPLVMKGDTFGEAMHNLFAGIRGIKVEEGGSCC